MSNQFQLAKKLIQETKDIFIIPSKTKQEESMSNALALFYGLKKIGKNVNILTDKNFSKQKFFSKIKFLDYLEQQELIISINNTSVKQVSELRYEKNIKELKIYISTNGKRIDNQDISLKQGTSIEKEMFKKQVYLNKQPVLLIVLGRSNPEEITLFYKNKNIIFKRYGLGVNNNNFEQCFNKIILKQQGVSLTEILIKILKTNGLEIIDKNIATCLLAGLILKTKNFHYSYVSPQYFACANFLIEKGADYQKIAQQLISSKEEKDIKKSKIGF